MLKFGIANPVCWVRGKLAGGESAALEANGRCSPHQFPAEIAVHRVSEHDIRRTSTEHTCSKFLARTSFLGYSSGGYAFRAGSRQRNSASVSFVGNAQATVWNMPWHDKFAPAYDGTFEIISWNLILTINVSPLLRHVIIIMEIWQCHPYLDQDPQKYCPLRALCKWCRRLFEQYIAEDIYFLDVFALALVVAIKKARDLDVQITEILTDLHSGIAEELKLHKGYQEQLCRKSTDQKAGHQATIRYTNFLMQTAEKEVLTFSKRIRKCLSLKK